MSDIADPSTWKKTPDGIAIPPPSDQDVLYELRENVAWITLNRPVVLNALNKNMQRRILAAMERAEADPEAHVVVLMGAGRAFSAGGDMWSGLYPDDDPAPSGHEVQKRVWGLEKPVIAAVRGHAVGQGFELSGACDITIASETAKFGEIQIRNGVSAPLLITPYLVSIKHAKQILLLGDVFDANEALRMGIVNAVVPDDQLEATAEAMAKKMAKLPNNIVRLNKRLTNRVYELAGIDAGLAWAEVEELQELQSSGTAAAERSKLRETQGWAAFKQERDAAYDKK